MGGHTTVMYLVQCIMYMHIKSKIDDLCECLSIKVMCRVMHSVSGYKKVKTEDRIHMDLNHANESQEPDFAGFCGNCREVISFMEHC